MRGVIERVSITCLNGQSRLSVEIVPKMVQCCQFDAFTNFEQIKMTLTYFNKFHILAITLFYSDDLLSYKIKMDKKIMEQNKRTDNK